MFDILFINPNTEKENLSQWDPSDDDDRSFKAFLATKFNEELLTSHQQFHREPPSGILLLAAILETAEYSVDILDGSIHENVEEELINVALNYRCFGLTALTNTFHKAIKYAQIIRTRNPEAFIVIGGPHASFTYEEILQQYPEFDVVAIGEAEGTIIPLMTWLLEDPVQFGRNIIDRPRSTFDKSPTTIPIGCAIRTTKDQVKILFYTDNHVQPKHFNPLSYTIFFSGWPKPVNLNQNPLPARHLLHAVYDVANVSFNRGCPNQCSFCSRQRLFSHQVRVRDLNQIQSELQEIMANYKYKFVNFYDNVNIQPKIFREFLQMLIKMRFKIPWGCELRADILTYEDCLLMKKAGCVGAATGIESADDGVLRANFKYQDPEKVRIGIQNLKKAGIKVQAYFVVGLPGDSKQSFQTTLEYFKTLNLDNQDEVDFFIATPYPGSKLCDQRAEFGIDIKMVDFRFYDCEHFIFETSLLKKRDIYAMYQESLLLIQKMKSNSTFK